jgi:hypothetical protein
MLFTLRETEGKRPGGCSVSDPKPRPLRYGGYLKEDFYAHSDGSVILWKRGAFVGVMASVATHYGYHVKLLHKDVWVTARFARWVDVIALFESMGMGDTGAADPRPPTPQAEEREAAE